MRSVFLIALLLLMRASFAQDDAPSTNAPPPPPKPKPAAIAKSKSGQTAAQLQAALDQLTQSNRDLLDLLKKQQAVLQDMQYDRRLQSRQIQSLEERLTEALQENAGLEKKVATLATEAAVRPAIAAAPAPVPTPTPVVAPTNAVPVVTAPVVVTPPAQPASYLPPADSDGPPGSRTWHRLFTLKGNDARQTDLFNVQGRTWRVLWHNQDPTGKGLANTSGLFINAFPKNDTIPQRVCGKVGSGGDAAVLQGPGNYYLKIEASGGTWELAVEDFH